MNQELLRIVEGLARDKNIDKEVVFEDLEVAMVSAIRKAHGGTEDIEARIHRETGEITAAVGDKPLSVRELGRIAAQTAKQVMIQKIREAERGSIYEEFLERRGQIVTGRVSRREGSTLIVEVGRVEAILPRSEQIPGETHMPENRIRAMVLDVRDQGNQVRIVLSRSHPDFIRRLFELEVPEVGEMIIEICALAREAGYRTKVAVNSLDSRVDAVGACVGVRGSRIKSIVEELGGEKIDIVPWHESSKILISNALRPAEAYDISLCFELGRAIVVVTDDQLSLAIGKRGQNVRLAARLTQWDIDILTPAEFNNGLDVLEKALLDVEGVDKQIISQIIALGMVSVLDVEEVGREPLIKELQLDADLANRIVTRCAEEARRVAEAQAKQAAEAQAKQAAEAQAEQAAEKESQAGESPEPTPADQGDAEQPAPEAPVEGPQDGGGAEEAPADEPAPASGEEAPAAVQGQEAAGEKPDAEETNGKKTAELTEEEQGKSESSEGNG